MTMDRSFRIAFAVGAPPVMACAALAVVQDWPAWLFYLAFIVLSLLAGTVMTVLAGRADRQPEPPPSGVTVPACWRACQW